MVLAHAMVELGYAWSEVMEWDEEELIFWSEIAGDYQKRKAKNGA